ncbi:ParB/RepB/Spo0J family partition protein [Deinococcus yavapaiensis]|uniref:ParB family chromosome partitioning protein n=1 Tax=Deinococcus yavapaiensis KR-236 TaxID=694435 RepID=A0A318S270_9DEIO|nr:ParB/RepB/Spo0J family partition protein [Deinococcus yavapaiensis]PYE49469.1 ParB family chromosome partitioning protein [Deinococcus yavapaiensis KR-236]
MPKPKGDARRGALGALIANITPVASSELPRELDVAALTPSRVQPRRHFDEGALRDLAASVRANGVLQPLLVRPVGDAFEIVAGERRWRAAQLAGLERVPVVVRVLSDEDARDAAAVENLQRADLNVIDEVDITVALAARVLAVPVDDAPSRLYLLANRPTEDLEAVAQLEDLFARLGRGTWTSFVKNKLRVLRWPEDVLTAMRHDGLGYSVAGVVAASPEERREELLRMALGGATKAELREYLLTFRKGKPIDATSRVAKALQNKRLLDSLSLKDRRRVTTLVAELERLLGQPTDDHNSA